MTVKPAKREYLPIDSCIPAVLDAVAANVPIILAAPPGAGKTTMVPLALLEAGSLDQQIVMVEPRRMAARLSAKRIAELHGSAVGTAIGYHVRFDKQASSATRVLSVTPGILLRRLIDDPAVEQVSCVILDEFHERSLEYDLLLGILRRLRQSQRPDLRIIVMSATLNCEELQAYDPTARTIISEGRCYPVEVRYVGADQHERLELQIARQVETLREQTAGHMLVFLPGRGEIAKVHRYLDSQPSLRGIQIAELFGEQAPEAQDDVLRTSSLRKVILSTNVAETSVTIEGVTAVIDSGLARVAHFDPDVGLPRLQLEPVSLASADQRAGRAGRTAPGICVRLWPQIMDRQRRQHLAPEIQRSDLSDAVLLLFGLGETEIEKFPWLTSPRATSVESAIRLLNDLGAIDSDRRLTSLGQSMQRYALHPRLSRMMLAAEALDCVTLAALVASLLSDRSPFTAGSQGLSSFQSKLTFLHTALSSNDSDRDRHSPVAVHPGRLRELLRSARQILRSAKSRSDSGDQLVHPQDDFARLAQALLQAFPDRVAKLRAPGASTGVMIGGRGIQITTHVPGNCQWVLCIEVEGSGKEATVREFLPVDAEWFSTVGLRQVEELEWSDSSQSVIARQRRYYFDLVLSETPKNCKPSAESAAILQRHASSLREQWYPDGDHPAAGFIERVQLLARLMPDLSIEPIEGEAIELLLDELCQTRTSIDQLKRAPWLETLQAMFNYQTLQAIDHHAPTQLILPSGNRTQVNYAAGKKPFIEARIQELFGWRDTPRIAGGRLTVQIHLLGPNYRPQQITEDLGNFWKTTYFDVRKELKRRYPKHHWPEDPLTAQATRNGLQPRE